jgi:hypothetical protein
MTKQIKKMTDKKVGRQISKKITNKKEIFVQARCC